MKTDAKRNRRWIIILLFIAFAALVTVDYCQKLNRLSPYGYEKAEMEQEVPLSALLPGESFSQEIPWDEDLAGISLSLNVYERGNGGTLIMKAAGNRSGEVLAEKQFAVSQLVLESRADLMLERKPAAEDDAIVLTVTAGEGRAPLVTAWATKEDAVPDAALTVKGEEQAGDLVFQRIVRKPDRYTYVTVVYILMMAVGMGGLALLLFSRAKTEKTVFVLVLAIGLLYMLTMTPLSVPDEQTHYQTAYRLSSVMMFQRDRMDEGENVYFDYTGLGGHYNMGSAYDRIVEEITVPKAQDTGYRVLRNRIDYELMYVPQAVGITIGRLLGANFLILFWLGRLTNLLFYAGCVLLAVKSTTRFGTLLALIALMPMAMQQAASYSYDTYINGLALLLTALILRAIDRKGRMKTGEYLAILAVSMVMSPAKAVYTPLLALMLFVPAARYGSMKRKLLQTGYVWAAALATVALFQLTGIQRLTASGSGETNWEGAMNYSLSFLVSHPADTVRLFINTFRTNLSEWLYQAVGSRLSGLSLEVTSWKITVYLVLLFFACLTAEGSRQEISGYERAAFLGVSALTVFLVMLTMLLNWTSQNDTMIQGIQGRYFIPVLPLLWMCLNNRVIRLNRNPEKILLICALAVHLAVLSGVLRVSVLVVR